MVYSSPSGHNFADALTKLRKRLEDHNEQISCHEDTQLTIYDPSEYLENKLNQARIESQNRQKENQDDNSHEIRLLKIQLEDRDESIQLLREKIKQLTAQSRDCIDQSCQTENITKNVVMTDKSNRMKLIETLIHDKETLTEQIEKLQNTITFLNKKMSDDEKKYQGQIQTQVDRKIEQIKRSKIKNEKVNKDAIREEAILALEPQLTKQLQSHKKEIGDLKIQFEQEKIEIYKKAYNDCEHQLQDKINDAIVNERKLHENRIEMLEKQLIQMKTVNIEYSVEQNRVQNLLETIKNLTNDKESLEMKNSEIKNLNFDLNMTVDKMEKLYTDLSNKIEEQSRKHQMEIQSINNKHSIDNEAWKQSFIQFEKMKFQTQINEIIQNEKKQREIDISKIVDRLSREQHSLLSKVEKEATFSISQENKILEKERDLLLSENKALEIKNEKLQSEISLEIPLLKGQLMDKDEQTTQLNITIGELNKHVNLLKDEINTYQLKIKELESQIVVFKSERDVAIANVDSTILQSRMSYENRVREIEKNVTSTMKLKEEEISHLKHEIDKLRRGEEEFTKLLNIQREQLLK